MDPLAGGNAPALATALHELSAVLITAEELGTMLQRTAEIAATTVPGGGAIGIALLGRRGSPLTVAASDPIVQAIEEAQFTAGRGPGPAALRDMARIEVPEVGADMRWPAFDLAVRTAGIRSTRSEPLHVGEAGAGVLTLYSGRPDAFGGEAGRTARLVADHVEVLLTAHLDRADQAMLAEQMRRAMESRATIDQAIGIVMVQRECAPEQAFAVLREASNRSNTRLRELAARLVESVAGRVPR